MCVIVFTGISPDEIVKVSTNYNDKHEQNSSKQKGNRVRNNLKKFFSTCVMLFEQYNLSVVRRLTCHNLLLVRLSRILNVYSTS